MPLSFHRRSAVVDRLISYVEFNRLENGLIAYWDAQEQSGAVLPCFNSALALGRNVATLTYAAYTPGANWANSSGQIARHTTGATATIQQDDIIAPGKTWQYPVVMSNRTAGSVSITGGDVSVNSNGTTIVTITATGADVIVTPSDDFDGDIDLAQGTVKQTDIAGSSAFPGAQLYVTPNAASDPAGNEADATTGWTDALTTLTSDSTIKAVGDYSIKAVFAAAGSNINFDLNTILTVGVTYWLRFASRHLGTGGRTGVQLAATTSGLDNIIVFLENTDVTFIEYFYPFTHSATTRYFTARERNETDDGGVYLDNISITEANPMNGDITGLSLGIPSGTQLEYLVSSDGVNDNLSIDSAELNSFINWDNLSFDMWAQADTWAAGTDYLFNFGIDSNNYFRGYRTGANLIIERKAGGTQKSITKASGSPSGLFHFGGSIDTDGSGTITLIYNGLPGGTATGLGTMVGNLSSDETAIGAFDDSGSNSWAGDWGHPTLFNITKTDGDWIRRFEAGGV